VSSANEVEHKLLLAMMQFGAASRAESATEKLPAYLTVLETLLAREEGETNKRPEKIARRLSTSDDTANRANLEERLTHLYDLRRRPVHFGYRTFRGVEVIPEYAVEQSKILSYLAIRLVLDADSNLQTHDALLARLDAKALGR